MSHRSSARSGMRSILSARFLVAALTLGLMALAVAACGSDSDSGSGGKSSASDYKMAVLLGGTRNDGTFSQEFSNGVTKSELDLGLKPANVRVAELITTPDQMLQQASASAADGAKVVFLIHGAFTNLVPQLAKRFPNVRFCGIGRFTPEQLAKQPKNVCYFDPDFQYAAFAGGAAAALASKTGHVGSVAAMDFPSLTVHPEAFQLGARCVNPDIKYSQIYSGDFVDPAKAKAAAESLYNGGADVLEAAVDAAVQGVITAAYEGKDHYVVAEYADNYPRGPKVVMTSALFGLPKIAQELVKDGMDGKLKQQYRAPNLWSLAPFREHEKLLTPENKKKLDEIVSKIRSGEIKVPDVTQIGKRGSARKIDPASIGC